MNHKKLFQIIIFSIVISIGAGTLQGCALFRDNSPEAVAEREAKRQAKLERKAKKQELRRLKIEAKQKRLEAEIAEANASIETNQAALKYADEKAAREARTTTYTQHKETSRKTRY